MRVVEARVEHLDRAFSIHIHTDGDAFVSKTIAETGCWEPFETEIVRRLLVDARTRMQASRSGEGPLFVDAGANLGWYSVVAGLLGADVLACEPMPANAQLLRSNVMANGLRARVHVHEGALGEWHGRATLHLSSTNQGDHRLHVGGTSDPSKERPTVDVSVTPLEAVLASAPSLAGRRPSVIKIDTQGSEVGILRGGFDAWMPQVGLDDVALVTEFWPYGLERCGSSAEEFLDLLTPLIDVSHRCFEIVEHDRSLASFTAETLREKADSNGMSLTVRGFVNLVFVPIGNEAAVTSPR